MHFDVDERRAGASTWSSVQLFGLALRAITAFSAVPLRIVNLAGLVFMFVALVLAAQTLYMKISGLALTGFTTVILLILITSSLLMFALGVIGEYVARIYDEVKCRPRYLVQERCKATPSKDMSALP